MDRLLSFVPVQADVRVGGGDSFTDQLNSCHTVIILTLFVSIVSAKYFFNEPIDCWCPAHFESSQVDFANKACWTSNTYYLPYTKDYIPREGAPREHISYYQWVAFILAAQAFLFCLPRIIWKQLNKKSGISVCTITDAAIQCQKSQDAESRDKIQKYMTRHMGRYLLEQIKTQEQGTKFQRLRSKFYGNYLIVLYIFIKILYIANAVGQIFLLNAFLGNNYDMYGFDVLRRMMQGENWITSDRFPRITFCDFKIRRIGNIHRYTVQCALPMNLINEMIFIFVWFWLAFVGACTIFSLISWIFHTILFGYPKDYLRKRLIATDKIKLAERVKDKNKDDKLNRFIHDFLKRDGCFILYLVQSNASDVIAAEFIGNMWDHFTENENTIQNATGNFGNDKVLDRT